MSVVFLSYKRGADSERANRVRDALSTLGIDVFIDLTMESGADFQKIVYDEIEQAKAVFVLWTQESIKSEWVRAEALHGNRLKKLVAATFEGLDPSTLLPPFNGLNTPDLSDWLEQGAPAAHKGWQRVLDALGRKLDRRGLNELAPVLEDGGEEVRRQFVQRFRKDPIADRMQAELDTVEQARIEFNKTIASEQGKFDRRIKEARTETAKRLRVFHDDFDSQVKSYFQTGGEFWAPDPARAFQDKVGYWKVEAEKWEANSEHHQTRADEAERLADERNTEIAALKGRIESQSSAGAKDDGTLDRLKASLDDLQLQLEKKDALLADNSTRLTALRGDADKAKDSIADLKVEFTKLKDANADAQALIASKATENTALQTAADAERKEKDGEIAKLKEANDELARTAEKRRARQSLLALAALLAAFVGVGGGWLLFGKGATDGQTASLTAEVKRLTDQTKELQAQVKRISDDNGTLAEQNRKLVQDAGTKETQLKQATASNAELTRRLNEAATATAALNTKISQLTTTNTGLSDKVAQLTATNGSLTQQIAQLTSQIKQLKDEIERLKQPGSQAPAPSSGNTPPPPKSSFSVYINYDMKGDVIRRLPRVEASACRAACEGEQTCKGYTYDKWNRHCTIKSSVTTIWLEPKGDTGIRSDLPFPGYANGEKHFCSYSGKRFSGSPFRVGKGTSVSDCEQQCENESSCVVYGFSKGQCSLFNNTITYVSDGEVESGVRTERPCG